MLYLYMESRKGRNPRSSNIILKGRKNSWKIIDFSLDSFPAIGVFNSTVWTDVFYVREPIFTRNQFNFMILPQTVWRNDANWRTYFEIGLNKVVLDDHTNLSQHGWNYPPKSSAKSKKVINSFWKRNVIARVTMIYIT